MTVRPLTLEAQPVDDGVLLRVVGHSVTAIEGRFALTVMAGSNHSTHHGAMFLRPGESAVLSTMSVTTAPSAIWRATLRVEPLDAASYEQVEQSA